MSEPTESGSSVSETGAEPLYATAETGARLFGIPVIYLALVVFMIIIAILAWFDLLNGSMT